MHNTHLHYISCILMLLLVPFTGMSKPDTVHISVLNQANVLVLDSVATIYKSELNQRANTFLQSEKVAMQNKYGSKQQSLWTHLYLKNEGSDTQTVYLFLGYGQFEHKLYSIENTQPRLLATNGYFNPYSQRQIKEEYDYLKVSVPPQNGVELLTQTSISVSGSYEVLFQLVSEKTYLYGVDSKEEAASPFLIISIFFQGAVWIMMLYMLLLYFQNQRQTVFIAYGGYLLAAMLYMLFKTSVYLPLPFGLNEYPLVRFWINEPLQFFMAIGYNLFAVTFLNIKKRNPALYRFVLVLNSVYLLYAILASAYFWVTLDAVLIRFMFMPSRLVMLIAGVVSIVWLAAKVKGPLVKYLVTGSIIFFVGNLLAIVFSATEASVTLYFPFLQGVAPINFTHFGIFLEILVFSMGIGKMIQLANKEKEEINDALIHQLIENEKLSKQLNKELEEEVSKRTQEVVSKTKELQNAKEAALKNKYEKQLVESEMNSLRLQMNPHFIFNSLNSIRYFILKEQSDKATDYITSFSKLLRMILHHSKQLEVSLEDELTALGLYLMFESERFSEKFDYQIEVDDAINKARTFIQPLLIQPFVENAIWHGLMHKAEKGKLLITIKKLGEKSIEIHIEDNGVGRTKAAELKSKKHGNQKSYGMEITDSRLKAMNKISKGNAGFKVLDLVEPDGKAAGTRIIITLNTNQYEGNNY